MSSVVFLSPLQRRETETTAAVCLPMTCGITRLSAVQFNLEEKFGQLESVVEQRHPVGIVCYWTMWKKKIQGV